MIPKRIHLCWLSGDPYPQKIQKCIDSWKVHLPDYEIMLWDLKRFDIAQVPWVEQAFRVKKYAFAADYIRLYALYNYGGIYLDSDVEVLKSFDPLLDLPYFVGAENAGTIEAAIIGAEKGCDWIKACLDYYKGRNFIQENGQMDIRNHPALQAGGQSDGQQHRRTEGPGYGKSRICAAQRFFLSEDIRLQRGDRHRQHLCHPSLSEFLVLTPGVHLLPHENLLYKVIRIQLYPAHRETDSKKITSKSRI